jgi:hypothetical protein
MGDFCRKYTVLRGIKLGLRRWYMNTERATAIGRIEGPSDVAEAVKKLLETFGCSKSKIESD